jgi:hypothetical protein
MRVFLWCWYLTGTWAGRATPGPFRDLHKGGRKGPGFSFCAWLWVARAGRSAAWYRQVSRSAALWAS